MCGFTGFYCFNPDNSRAARAEALRKMTATLTHRGPDDEEFWHDPDKPLSLGFRRLSILDLTEEGRQPMASESGRYRLVYNGEIYNHPALKKDLERTGTTFRGRSDTEVILAAIEYWGLNRTIQKLNGMFAFALWDRREERIHFARDRLGKKPLYIGWAGKDLVFASELKALRAHPEFRPELNRRALALYMERGYVCAPHCIYKKVWALPAGHRLSLDLSKLEPGRALDTDMEPYWHHLRVLEDSKTRAQSFQNEERTIEEFESLLSTCIQDRMISDVPLGAFLSGGIDSSAIVALMQKSAAAPVKSYTIGFHEDGFDEACHAKKIAAHLGTDHHDLYMSEQDALEVIPRLPEIYDEPFADISAIPTYLVSRFARKSVTVALSGDGGDEMLGGYARHFTAPKIWNRMRLMPRPLRILLSHAIRAVPPARWDKLLSRRPQAGTAMNKLAALLPERTPGAVYERLLAQWDHVPVTEAARPHLPGEAAGYRPADLSFAEEMMYRDTLSYLPNSILTKVDRASMAVSLEVRAPLLDKRIYEYVWGLPPAMKIRKGQGKYLLRRVLERHVPPALFERPKQGFTMPVGAWLRGPLRGWAEDLLDEKGIKEAGLLDGPVIRRIWQDHLRGAADHGPALWTALMFQAWKKHWF